MSTISFNELFFSKVQDFLDIYLEKQCSRSSHTIKTYRDSLTVFRRYVFERGLSIKKFRFDDCSRDFVLGFLEHLREKGNEKSTCNQRLAAIKAYLWYVADGDVSRQTIALAISHVPFLRESDKKREVLSEDCLKAILVAPADNRIGIRDKTMLIVLYDSAVRLSELLNLKISDVNLNSATPYLRIRGKGDKERIVSITDKTVKHLNRYIALYHEEAAAKTNFLFYTVIRGRADAMSPGNVERIINKYASAVRKDHPDLPQKVHPHMFRRTRATNLYRSDIELELVSRILGHASTQTTRIYALPSLEMMKNAMDKSSAAPEPEEPLWPEDETELAKLFGLR